MGSSFSSSMNPDKLVLGNKYVLSDGSKVTFIGTESKTGPVTPGDNSKIATATFYKFTNDATGAIQTMSKEQMNVWKLKPAPTVGGKKTRHGKRSKKSKTSKKRDKKNK